MLRPADGAMALVTSALQTEFIQTPRDVIRTFLL